MEDWGLELQVFGVTNSQWMLLSASPISLSSWETALSSQVSILLEQSSKNVPSVVRGRDYDSGWALQDTEASLDSFTYHFATSPVTDRVIIDCTASTEVPCHYTK